MIEPEDIKSYREKAGLIQKEFAAKIGVSEQTIVNWEKGTKIPKSKMVMLEGVFSGESNNLKEQRAPYFTNSSGNEFAKSSDGQLFITVPVVPLEAHALYLSEMSSEAHKFQDFEKVTFPATHLARGNYLGFRISGDSMNGGRIYDTPDKALVLARELSKSQWEYGFDPAPLGWVIVSHQNILFKDIVAYDKATGRITCHSRNTSPEYQDFDICLNEVHQIFKVCKRTF